jgi:hypothetical protein
MFKVGDKFYLVREQLSGIEWFRYNNPIRSYTIEEWDIVGRVVPQIEGELVECEWAISETVLHCKSAANTDALTEIYLASYINAAQYYFTTKQAAQDQIDTLMLKEKDL